MMVAELDGEPVAGCPYDAITPNVADVMMGVELAGHGSWPLAGGWLDQSAALVRVVGLYGRLLTLQDRSYGEDR